MAASPTPDLADPAGGQHGLAPENGTPAEHDSLAEATRDRQAPAPPQPSLPPPDPSASGPTPPILFDPDSLDFGDTKPRGRLSASVRLTNRLDRPVAILNVIPVDPSMKFVIRTRPEWRGGRLILGAHEEVLLEISVVARRVERPAQAEANLSNPGRQPSYVRDYVSRVLASAVMASAAYPIIKSRAQVL